MKILSANDLLAFFLRIAPAFENLWEAEDNYHIRDDGSFNFHDVCSEFSRYFVDQISFGERTYYKTSFFPDIETSKLRALFDLIENNLIEEGEPENDLDNALCTCFLENIANTKAGEHARKFMGDKSKTYFDKWNV